MVARLSIGEAWEDTAAFLKRQGQPVFLIALLFLALPSVLVELLGGPGRAATEMPEPGLWVAVAILSGVVGMIASLAIAHLAIRADASPADALRVAARRLLPLLGASLLLALGAAILFVPLLLLAGGGQPTPQGPAFVVLVLMLAATLGILYVIVRLMLMTAIAAAEPGGPVALIRRSWELTRGHFWRLFGFIVLMGLAIAIVATVAGLMAGLLGTVIGGPNSAAQRFLAMLVGAGFQAAGGAILTAALARIYVRLSGRDAGRVFA